MFDRKELIEEFYYNLPDEKKDEWVKTRKACDESHWNFIRIIGDLAIFKVHEKGLEGASPIIHKPLSDFWDDNSIPYKAIHMGRYWRKSTYYTCLDALREYLLNPNIRILLASQKQELVSRFLNWIGRQILECEYFRWVYPELRIVDRSYKQRYPFSGESILLPRNDSYIENTFHVIGVTGGSQGGHFDLIYPDDLLSEKGMESELILEDACRWFDNVHELLVETDTTKPNASRIKICGTHWKPGDHGVYIQTNYPEVQWRIIPALKKDDLKDSDHIKYIQNPNVGNMESNWPEAHSTEKYIEMLNNPEKRTVFWCQHMNLPTGASELTKFDTAWLRYFHFEDRDDGKYIVCDDDKEAFKLSLIPLYAVIDPGGFAEEKMIKKGSFNAFVIAGQPKESHKKFIVFTYSAQYKSTALFKEEVYKAHKEFHPKHWKIEVFGQQGGIYNDLRFDDPKEKNPERRKPPSFHITECPKDVGRDAKALRIQAVSPVMENGEIYVHKNMHKKLIAEIEAYPGLVKDLLDCVGWHNQLFWSRKPKNLASEYNRRQHQEYLQAISGRRTGY